MHFAGKNLGGSRKRARQRTHVQQRQPVAVLHSSEFRVGQTIQQRVFKSNVVDEAAECLMRQVQMIVCQFNACLAARALKPSTFQAGAAPRPAHQDGRLNLSHSSEPSSMQHSDPEESLQHCWTL